MTILFSKFKMLSHFFFLEHIKIIVHYTTKDEHEKDQIQKLDLSIFILLV